MTIYVEVDTKESLPGFLVTETTTADDIAEFIDCDPDDISGDGDGWWCIPALATDHGVGDVFDGDLILRLTHGDYTTAVNAYSWEPIPE